MCMGVSSSCVLQDQVSSEEYKIIIMGRKTKSVDLDSMGSFTFDKDSKASEGSFVNANGHKIYCRYWSPHLPSPRALLFICHGAAEHLGPYTELAELITTQNFYVFGHDHQGMGQSEGSRMHIDDFRDYSRDVFAHIDRIKVDFPGLPVYILGHSMGGAVTLQAALDKPDYFKGVVLIGPVVTNDQDTVGPVLEFFGRIVARIFPHFPVFNLDANLISRDPKVVEDYKNDKLNYLGACKAKWAVCLSAAMVEIESKLPTIEFPFLTMHGECDGLVQCIASKKLYEQAKSKDKTLSIYPKAYHQLHLDIEPDKSKACQEVVDWLVKHEE